MCSHIHYKKIDFLMHKVPSYKMTNAYTCTTKNIQLQVYCLMLNMSCKISVWIDQLKPNLSSNSNLNLIF